MDANDVSYEHDSNVTICTKIGVHMSITPPKKRGIYGNHAINCYYRMERVMQ
jgi:hypothetical protein